MDNDKSGMHRNASGQIFRNAIELRKTPTKAEEIIWDQFFKKRPMGFKFRFQHPFHIFILDFYCHLLKIEVEIDGKINEDKFQKMYDEERDNFLKDEGLLVVRINNDLIYNNLEEVKNNLLEIIKSRSQFIQT